MPFPFHCAAVYSAAQLCLTLCDPMDCNPPGPSVHGIPQARILELVEPFPPPGIFLTQGVNLHLLPPLQWQADSLPLTPPGKPSLPTKSTKSGVKQTCIRSPLYHLEAV